MSKSARRRFGTVGAVLAVVMVAVGCGAPSEQTSNDGSTVVAVAASELSRPRPRPDPHSVGRTQTSAPAVGGVAQQPDGLWAGPDQTCWHANGGAKCFGANWLGASTGQYSFDRGIEAGDMGYNLPAVDLGHHAEVRAVATGAYHACALLAGGKVKCWGNNRSGELGLGDGVNRTAGAGNLGDRLPAVDLGDGQRAVMISAGLGFSCALLACGNVKCWGDNSYGSLGLGDTKNHGVAAGEMGDQLPPVNLGTGHRAKMVAAGHAHACAILDDDTLKCWGLNTYGQLGQGDGKIRGFAASDMGDALLPIDLGTGHHAKSVSVSANQTCAVLENDSLKCWGFNGYGNLGLGDTSSRGDGPNEMGDQLPTVDLGRGRTVRSLALGGGFSCAVLDDASLKCWGNNDYGTLGLGDRERRGDSAGQMGDALPAVALGHGRRVRRAVATFLNACAELDNGRVKCWGSSATGMLGIGPSDLRGDQPSDMGDQLPSFSLGGGSISAFSSGFAYHFGCALLCGQVKCWGANSFGQLGSARSSNAGDEPGDLGQGLTALQLGTGRSVAAIAPGNYHSCALLDDGSVKCWGANLLGTLGQGDAVRRDGRPSYMGDHLPRVDLGSGRTVTSLAVGADHSCAILDDASLKCWGDNSLGELGLGDKVTRGDSPSQMGDQLGVVDLGAGRTAKTLSLGYRHTCALLDNDTIKCWGWNLYGQLGIGVFDDRGDGASEMGDDLPAVSLGDKKPVAVYAGYANTCASFEDGTLKCWGMNSHGELGLGDTNWRGSDAATMGSALPTVDVGTNRTVLTAGVGLERVCALLDDHTVKCWGYGAYGALGYGDQADRGSQPGQMGDDLPAVDLDGHSPALGLAVSWSSSCALLSSGVKCWGLNRAGELGLADTVDRGGKVDQMGDRLGFVSLGAL